MAWRIEESVIRGEIDNRVRGRVTGRIWFAGKDEPVELDLTGNAWRDLAGRHLEFTNPEPKASTMLERFPARQTGVIGDCTASRKVKVPDIPMDQIGEYYEAKKAWTWHWGNSLYLEWFSATNGRVVIESASYQLIVSPDITWEMTADEEEAQRRANGKAVMDFLGKLGGAAPAQEETREPWEESSREGQQDEARSKEDTHRPFTEEEAEQLQEESERLVDRIHARMEREGDGADFERILEEELEKRRKERGEAPPTPEELERRERLIEKINRAAAESASKLDSEMNPGFDPKHALAERAQEIALRLLRDPHVRGWVPAEAGEEHPLVDVGMAAAKAGTKFALGLNGVVWPPPVEFCANRIVSLKRARGYLDDALAAADMCAHQELADAEWIVRAQRELAELGRECDAVIAELRTRLERGNDPSGGI